MRALVTGGAGYVGSVCAEHLRRRGDDVVVFDDLSTGHADAVRGELVVGDILDEEHLTRVLRRGFDVVLHFAGVALVGESVRDPEKYLRINVAGTASVLRAMRATDVRCLVFSSSCAIYGNPAQVPVTEAHPAGPTSPYGASKWLAEGVIDEARAEGLRAAPLRYFNAAGAWPDAGLGERHREETHLIPLAIDAVLDRRPPIAIFGDTWPTPDGTCVRDYVHVRDLAHAHALAADRLVAGWPGAPLNLGTGRGSSVRQVLDAIGDAADRPVPWVGAPPRDGDPASVWAAAEAALVALGWRAERSLHDAVRDAFAFVTARE